MASRIARNRCVVLLGESEAGKSTVANHLVGHDPLSPDEPPFADSVTEVKHKTVEFMWENDLYRVTVVDTPGLYLPNGDKLTFDKIVQYVRENKLRIDLILFVVKKGRPFAKERAMFLFIMAKFHENHSALAEVGCPKEISPISVLLVTGCENETTITRQQLVQEFEVDPSTREVASQMGMGIYPVGFPNVERFPNPDLQRAYNSQMEKDQDTLRGLIARARPSS